MRARHKLLGDHRGLPSRERVRRDLVSGGLGRRGCRWYRGGSRCLLLRGEPGRSPLLAPGFGSAIVRPVVSILVSLLQQGIRFRQLLARLLQSLLICRIVLIEESCSKVC